MGSWLPSWLGLGSPGGDGGRGDGIQDSSLEELERVAYPLGERMGEGGDEGRGIQGRRVGREPPQLPAHSIDLLDYSISPVLIR